MRALAILFALAAALCNAMATIFERLGVESAPESPGLSPRLIAHVLRRPIWFIGLASMGAAFAFQAAALSEGGLTLVQPLLVTELLFLVVILRVYFGRPLGWREAAGTLGTVAGLAVFLGVSNQGGGTSLPSVGEWLLVIGTAALAITAAVALSGRCSRSWRAAWLGSAAGVAFALSASLTKSATTLLARGGAGFMFSHFEPYAVAVVGTVGLLLAQYAYKAGPITASQATLLIVDPIASIVIGVGVFGDDLRGGLSALTLDAVALAVMSAGLAVLCHSPLISSTLAEERLSRPRAEEIVPLSSANSSQ